MSYPPPWRQRVDSGFAVEVLRAHPFAHLFTAAGGLRSTRIPFVADCDGDRPVHLRGHLNGQNPQARALVECAAGAPVLVAFSGPATYVSPHWRAEKTRAGTYDFEEVVVRGTARVVADLEFFRRLVDDLAALIEPQYAEVGDYPVWRTTMAPAGYIERLFPAVTPLQVEIEEIEAVSKLHQHFPEADRRSIAEHLARSHREDARAIGSRIRRSLSGD